MTSPTCPHCGAEQVEAVETTQVAWACGSWRWDEDTISTRSTECYDKEYIERFEGPVTDDSRPYAYQALIDLKDAELTRLRSENEQLRARIGELRDLIRPYIKDEEDIIAERQGYFSSTYQSWFRSLLSRLREILIPAAQPTETNESEGE